MARIQCTRLEYQGNKSPYSTLFDDLYFAAEQGIEESTYVYLEGTELRERLSLESKGSPLCVGEIGFGVGLNFLLTLREFNHSAHSSQSLHYFAVEKYPVFEKDLHDLYLRFPELKNEADLLLDRYPILTPGIHLISMLEGRVKLYLLLGDAAEMLTQLNATVDLWYWDGFSPDKNPEAFSEKLFAQVRRLSAAGARGASFSAAGWVRRGLELAGFRIEKRMGFQFKRECIVGIFTGERASSTSRTAPWFSNENLSTLQRGQKIAVVGAGLSGSAIANVLAKRGFNITVFDPNGVANRASGNSVGLFNIQLSKLPNPISRYSQLALTHFISELKTHDLVVKRGIFRIDEATQAALESSEYPEDFYSRTTRDDEDGFLLPQCGFLNPQKLCLARLKHSSITLKTEKATSEILEKYDHVVYALGADLMLESQALNPELQQLPLRAIRGQTIEVKPTNESKSMTEAWVKNGYVSPITPEITGHSLHLIGATYQAKTIAENQVELDTAKLITDIRQNWKSFEHLNESDVCGSRVGYRLSTPDKLPLIGPLFDGEQLKTVYAKAFRGSAIESLPPLPIHARQWLFLGMGSRGIIFSSLGAEILAALMTGEALPVEADLWEHLHSARFSIRNLKRNEIR
jgi:tRNA 5-methylaminomethyl-2-thiouridine biosynthesis bifunctional protein